MVDTEHGGYRPGGYPVDVEDTDRGGYRDHGADTDHGGQPPVDTDRAGYRLWRIPTVEDTRPWWIPNMEDTDR